MNNGIKDILLPHLSPDTAEARRAPKNKKCETPPSLRPPTLMIDLLFGALMLFAFQMGDPNSVTVVPKDFDIPTSNEKAEKKGRSLLALKPVKIGAAGWVYELPSGKRLTAEAIVKVIKSENKTPVLLVPSDARVQSYINAEQPLRRLGIKAGLAVAVKRGAEK
jgi:hypothetical protein